jgi:hypothetical protein
MIVSKAREESGLRRQFGSVLIWMLLAIVLFGYLVVGVRQGFAESREGAGCSSLQFAAGKNNLVGIAKSAGTFASEHIPVINKPLDAKAFATIFPELSLSQNGIGNFPSQSHFLAWYVNGAGREFAFPFIFWRGGEIDKSPVDGKSMLNSFGSNIKCSPNDNGRSFAAICNYHLCRDRPLWVVLIPLQNSVCVELRNMWDHPRSFRAYDMSGLLQRGFGSILLVGNTILRSFSGVLGSFSGPSRFFGLLGNDQQGKDESQCCRPVWPSEEATPNWAVPFGFLYVFLGMIFVRYSGDSRLCTIEGFMCALLGSAFILTGYEDCHPKNYHDGKKIHSHNSDIVPQKHLTHHNYRGTVIHKANVLKTEYQQANRSD